MAAAIPKRDLRGHRHSIKAAMPGIRTWHYIGVLLFLLPAIVFSAYIIAPNAAVAYCSLKHRGFIENEAQAIRTARQVWFCINFTLEPASEQLWLKNFVADHYAGEWHVRQTYPEGQDFGARLHMDISDDSGRLHDSYLTD